MSITTKKGDRGDTFLYWGGKVSKDHVRIQACGTVDELCALLGFSKSLIKEKKIKRLLESIQADLCVVNAELVTIPVHIGKLKKRIDKADIARLEKMLLSLEKRRIIKERRFHLSGENIISSSLDIARTVARRAERHVVTLKRKNIISNPLIVIYLNRLSDLLYLLSRSYEKHH